MVYSSKDFESLWFLYQAEGLPRNISIEEFGILRKAWSRFPDFRQMVQKDAQESLSDSSDRNARRRRGGDSVRSGKG